MKIGFVRISHITIVKVHPIYVLPLLNCVVANDGNYLAKSLYSGDRFRTLFQDIGVGFNIIYRHLYIYVYIYIYICIYITLKPTPMCVCFYVYIHIICGMVKKWWKYALVHVFFCDMSLIARFMGPTWGPSGAGRTQVGPILAPLTLSSGVLLILCRSIGCWDDHHPFCWFVYVGKCHLKLTVGQNKLIWI